MAAPYISGHTRVPAPGTPSPVSDYGEHRWRRLAIGRARRSLAPPSQGVLERSDGIEHPFPVAVARTQRMALGPLVPRRDRKNGHVSGSIRKLPPQTQRTSEFL